MTDPQSLPRFQAFYPFTRLNRLLEGVAPGPSPAPDGAPVLLSLGEPRHDPPAFLAETLADNAQGWSRYPLPRGTPGYRRAAVAWLTRRYGLPADAGATGGALDPESAVLPLPGSREGLFFAALATVASARDPAGGGKTKVLLPNPFYHVYMGAALAAGGEPVLMPAARERGDRADLGPSGHLPDPEALGPEVLDRTALCYVCSPANPQGAVADLDRLARLIALARRHDFVLAFDECYSEIYTGAPPPGALQAALAGGGGLDNLLAFHSLSKRSSAPGLRCGFVVGDKGVIARLDEALRVGGAGVPLPVLAAGERLWQDEAHVAENRALYREKFAVAERILGSRFGFETPAGGFFLWLEVGDGEAAALELWRQGGLKVVPGAYMAADMPDGRNPGKPYIRVALIHDAALVAAALERLAAILTNRKSL